MTPETPPKDPTTDYLLTIAVPTFDRWPMVSALVDSLSSNIDPAETRVEIVIYDNDSPQSHVEVQRHPGGPVRTIRNQVNLGIEGNIIFSLLHSPGKYIWLLSDHQISVAPIAPLLDFLSGTEVDYVHCGIEQYPIPLELDFSARQVPEMSRAELSDIVYQSGNISTFLARSSLIRDNARQIFRFSGFSYPHLGIFCSSQLNKVAQAGILTRFDESEQATQRASYDRFKSRFIGNLEALSRIRSLNPRINASPYFGKSRTIITRGAIWDGIQIVCFDDQADVLYRRRELLHCAVLNESWVRWFYVSAFLLYLAPCSIRRLVCRCFFSLIIPAKFSRIRSSSHKFKIDDKTRE